MLLNEEHDLMIPDIQYYVFNNLATTAGDDIQSHINSHIIT